MNLWTLGASVQGHCEYLKQKFPGVSPLRVVLAYDVRHYDPAAFDSAYDNAPLEFFEPMVRRVLAAPRRSIYIGIAESG